MISAPPGIRNDVATRKGCQNQPCRGLIHVKHTKLSGDNRKTENGNSYPQPKSEDFEPSIPSASKASMASTITCVASGSGNEESLRRARIVRSVPAWRLCMPGKIGSTGRRDGEGPLLRAFALILPDKCVLGSLLIEPSPARHRGPDRVDIRVGHARLVRCSRKSRGLRRYSK